MIPPLFVSSYLICISYLFPSRTSFLSLMNSSSVITPCSLSFPSFINSWSLMNSTSVITPCSLSFPSFINSWGGSGNIALTLSADCIKSPFAPCFSASNFFLNKSSCRGCELQCLLIALFLLQES